ncbi:MAG: precorrin-6A reductase [Thermoanaerobacteraceae bacterium]|nr:precorrin-6A reductase [Thermoanaerobacteraceae bacterium]
MILVIGGTADGRMLAEYLQQLGYRVTVSVTTDLGGKLLQGAGIDVIRDRFTPETLSQVIRRQGVAAVVDASHPYAVEISKLAQQVCQAEKIPYIRYERRPVELPRHPLVSKVTGWEEVTAAVAAVPGPVFLTVGVKPLAILYQAGLMRRRRVIARVLPEESSIRACKQYGVAEIIAFCGVASKELNMALFKQYNAGVVVTKDSGAPGGTTAKIEAALVLEIPIVVVQRPAVTYKNQVSTFDGIAQFLWERGLK